MYRFAGGAPLYVPTWDDVGGSQPTILVNQDDLTRAGEAAPFDHIRRYPADGTFVNTPTRAVYRFAGGAPLYVPSWDDVGGSQPSTRVSQAPLDAAGDPSYPWGHVAKYPQDGTFVNTPTGTVYRFAGGAPLAVSSWEAVGGSHASTQVSAEVLERGGATPYPWGHTRFFPADGTVLSPLYVAWSFKVTGGVARKVTRQAGIAVDIAALDNAGRPIPWNHLKTSVPRATLNPLPTTTTQPTISLTWGALVTASRTVSYDVRWKTSTGVWKYPAAMQGLAASPVGGPLPRVGTRYCFSIRAHNAAGLTGPVSVASCTTRT